MGRGGGVAGGGAGEDTPLRTTVSGPSGPSGALGTASSRPFAARRRFRRGDSGTLLFQAVRQEDFHQRLVRNVALIGEELELRDHRLRQSKRDGTKGRTEVWQYQLFRLRPIDVLGRVFARPKLAFRVFIPERWNLLSSLHKLSARAHSCRKLISAGPAGPAT